MYKIHLEGIEVFSYHGVNPEEKKNGQVFLIDGEFDISFSPGEIGDDIERAVSYADLNKLIIKEVSGTRFNLIETLAHHLVREILDKFSHVSRVNIKISKPDAPMRGEFKNVAVSYEESRQ